MIRLIYCITRREDVSVEDFRRHWNDSFVPMAERLASFYEAKDYRVSATLAVGANATIREMKGTAEPHDGLLEMWWDNAATLMDKAGSDSAADLRAQVQALEAQFIDIDRSNLFFTDG